MTVRILLPAYNEEGALPRLLERLSDSAPAWGDEWTVTVIDDGSSDATASQAEAFASSMPLEVVRHGENQGLAAAFRTGLTHLCSTAEPDDVVLTMDADNTHDPVLIARMLDEVRQGSDIVIASRFVPGAKELGLSFRRKVLSRGARLVLAALFPMAGVKDYTCGYRAVRAGLLQGALAKYGDGFITATTFAATAEILLKLRSFAPRVSEVPLELHYERKEGASKMRVMRTVWGYAELWRTCRGLD